MKPKQHPAALTHKAPSSTCQTEAEEKPKVGGKAKAKRARRGAICIDAEDLLLAAHGGPRSLLSAAVTRPMELCVQERQSVVLQTAKCITQVGHPRVTEPTCRVNQAVGQEALRYMLEVLWPPQKRMRGVLHALILAAASPHRQFLAASKRPACATEDVAYGW